MRCGTPKRPGRLLHQGVRGPQRVDQAERGEDVVDALAPDLLEGAAALVFPLGVAAVHGVKLKDAAAAGLTGVNRAVVVRQQVVRRPLQVVELSRLERPPEGGAGQEYESDGERDEEVEAFHVSGAPSGREAFSMTMIELAPMPSAASHGPIQPRAAAGSATAL